MGISASTRAGVVCVIGFALVVAAAGACHAQEDAQWSTLTYPLAGNIRTQEGTLIVQFRIDEDLDAPMGEWFNPEVGNWWNRFTVYNLQINERNRLLLFWKTGADEAKGNLHTSISFPGDTANITGTRETSRWETGEIHTVGYTWTTEGIHQLWPDGESTKAVLSQTPSLGLGEFDPGVASLTFGGRGHAVTVTGVHILRRPLSVEEFARPSEELLEMTGDTMLLDTFEDEELEPGAKQQTRATFISGFSGERGGTVKPGCRLVETEAGPGIAVYTPPAGEQ
ncbi:MAG: hypothetical protein ACOCX2_13685 [Armatimonadota bacterium]